MPHPEKHHRQPTPDQITAVGRQLLNQEGVESLLRAGRRIYLSQPDEGNHNTVWVSPEGFRNPLQDEAFYELLPDGNQGKQYRHITIDSEHTFALVPVDNEHDRIYYVQIDGLDLASADKILQWRAFAHDQMMREALHPKDIAADPTAGAE